MTASKRIATLLLVGATFLLSLVFTIWVLDGVAVNMLYFDSHWVALSGFGAVVVSLACALVLARLVARACAKRWGGPVHLIPRSRWIVAPLLAGYLLTWAVGVPTVQSANASWAINHSPGYFVDPVSSRPLGRCPDVRTYVSFPVIPLVVVTLHRYQTGLLAGWGGRRGRLPVRHLDAFIGASGSDSRFPGGLYQ